MPRGKNMSSDRESSGKKKVKLVPMRVDDIERLYKVSESLGIPFREVVSFVARYGSKLMLLSNGELDKIVQQYKAIHHLSRLGFTILPLPILNKILEDPNNDIGRESMEIGKNLGAIYSINGNVTKDDIMGVLYALFPDSTQTSVNVDEDRIKIGLVLQGRTRKLINLTLGILEGFFEELGYTTVTKEVTGGLVVLEFLKKKGDEE